MTSGQSSLVYQQLGPPFYMDRCGSVKRLFVWDLQWR